MVYYFCLILFAFLNFFIRVYYRDVNRRNKKMNFFNKFFELDLDESVPQQKTVDVFSDAKIALHRSSLICDETKNIRKAVVPLNSLEYTVKCVSMNKLYFNDEGQRTKNVCKNGTLLYDPTTQMYKCICNSADTLGYFSTLHPHVPRCIRNGHLYADFIVHQDV